MEEKDFDKIIQNVKRGIIDDSDLERVEDMYKNPTKDNEKVKGEG